MFLWRNKQNYPLIITEYPPYLFHCVNLTWLQIPKTSFLQLGSNEPPHDKTNKMTAHSEDSDQPGHLPSLIRVFAMCSTKALFMRRAKMLIRLGGCPGWSKSSLGAHVILLVLLWGGSSFLQLGSNSCFYFVAGYMSIMEKECLKFYMFNTRLQTEITSLT